MSDPNPGLRDPRRTRRAALARRGTTQDAVRRHNLAALFRQVHSRGPTSRAQLTRALGLNRSTIAALVDDLVGRNLVEEVTAAGQEGPGRPSNVVRVRPDRVGVLSAVIGVDAIEVAAVAPGGHILKRSEVGLNQGAEREFARVVATIAREAKVVASDLPEALDLLGMSVAVPGIVRRRDGMVHLAPNLGWREQPLGERLRTRLRSRLGVDLPVFCSNDASLGALAEHTRGAAAGAANVVYVYGEVGVGGGIVAEGHLLDGGNGYAGEVGHMRVNPKGTECRCGSRGCWETEIGEDVLVALAGRTPGGRVVVEEVLAAARAGERTALGAVKSVSWWVGLGLANLINCLNPDMVVLAGLLSDLFDLAADEIRATMTRGLVTPAHLGVQLVQPQLGSESVLLGAAEVALEPVLSDPTTIALAL